MGKQRASGSMVPLTDEDIKNLHYVYEAAGNTLEGMKRWTGYSTGALKKWMTGGEYELTWRESVKLHFAKMVKELDPAPLEVAVRQPVFSGKSFQGRMLDLALALRGKDGELEALRLVIDLMSDA